MASIFIVEDDERLRDELIGLLELQGHVCSWSDSYDAMCEAVLAAHPDCVVLDLGLPGVSGQSICRELRRRSKVPIIMLTCSDSEYDEVMSLNLGADDFIRKPYSPPVLLARIASVLRHGRAEETERVITHRGVRLSLSSASLSYEGESTELTRNELRIASLLMSHPGEVIARAEIMQALWQSDVFIDDNTLTVNINRLRKTLQGLGVPSDFLQTRRGQGYQVKA